MELKAGYKNTEIGVIPEEWEMNIIDDVLKISTGSKNTQDKLSDGKYPFFVRSQTIERINSYSYDCEAVLTAGDGVGTGKIFHYVNEKFELHQRVYIMNEFKEKLNGHFFFLYFSNNFYNRVMQMTAKSSVDSVRREMIAEMKIPLPPLPEQTAIATVLSDTDSLIQTLKKKIAKKQLIKKGAIQKLLSPKEGWVVKTLGEISEITGAGIDKKINPNEAEVTLLNYMDIYKRDYIYQDELNHQVTTSISKRISCNVKKGDIFLTPSSELRTEIGVSAIAMEDMEGVVYSYHIYRLRYFIEIDALFGLYVLKTRDFLEQSETMCEGSGKRYVVSMGKFKNMSIFFPKSLHEQTHIAQIFSDMDNEIEVLQKKLTKYKQLKQGLMQNLLTGKIRLV